MLLVIERNDPNMSEISALLEKERAQYMNGEAIEFDSTNAKYCRLV